jgi:Asp-tRNA(Asn)/Glu-tRNA(Gln) amidotransferase A subunit family amidase
VNPQEPVDDCLDWIDRLEPVIRAWTQVDRDCVPDATKKGPLFGVPVGIKDIIDTADLPTSYGSPIYAGHRPTGDATCVTRLRSAGAVVLGKTVTTEFASSFPGPTRNPHDPARTPGGSSSGSAAAVASGMVPVALGTQTAGSTIRPAAYCGVFGFKPTFGCVRLEGVKPLSSRLDTIGMFARDAADLDVVLSVLAEPGTLDRNNVTHIERPRIAIARTSLWELADSSGKDAIEFAAKRFAQAGAVVEEAEPPVDAALLRDTLMEIVERDVSLSLATEYDNAKRDLSDRLRQLIERGQAIDEERYAAALATADRSRHDIAPYLSRFDFVLTLGVAGEAPIGLDSTGDLSFCCPWTLLGVPAVSVPGVTGPAGMPIGIQMVATWHHDRRLLRAASWAATALI